MIFSSQNTKLAILPSFTSTYECYFVDVPRKIKNRIRFVSLTHAYHTHTTDWDSLFHFQTFRKESYFSIVIHEIRRIGSKHKFFVRHSSRSHVLSNYSKVNVGKMRALSDMCCVTSLRFKTINSLIYFMFSPRNRIFCSTCCVRHVENTSKK